MQTRRLPRGGRIDRETPLTFSFNGHAYTGFAGDTLASALLANGIGVLARSTVIGAALLTAPLMRRSC